MFPAYSRTRKGAVVTDNYLYPFFHLRHGPALEGWQFWPLAGHEHKDITTHTNGFNEVETVPGHDNRFALWPVFFNRHSGLGSGNPQHELGVLPAYSALRSPKRDSTTVLWPFFSRINDRGKKYREWQAPWPLIEFARGQGKHTTRIWPFYSHSYNSNLVDDFYLWPIYKRNRLHADPLDRQRTRILFFLGSDMTARNTETGASRRRLDVWPLFTCRRDLDGNRRLQVLAAIEAFLPENPSIEREYAPLYSLWRSEKESQERRRQPIPPLEPLSPPDHTWFLRRFRLLRPLPVRGQPRRRASPVVLHSQPRFQNQTMNKTLASRFVWLLMAFGAGSLARGGSVSEPIPLWPKGAPDEKGEVGEEHDTTKPDGGLVAGQRVIRLGNVSKPTITLYRPQRKGRRAPRWSCVPAAVTASWRWTWKARKSASGSIPSA